jgi:hypothetical protein
MNRQTSYGIKLYNDARQVVHELRARALSGASLSHDRTLLSKALADLRSATNHLEGTSHFEAVHAALDQAGRFQRVYFPAQCELAMEGTAYSQECPVALAHNRIGVSIGAIIRESQCSICGSEPDDCAHISGRIYDDQECYQLITRADLDHVALVDRPDFPDARLTSVPYSTSELRSELGPKFIPGRPVICGRCLSRCEGMTRASINSSH